MTEEQQQMITDCENRSSQLNDWELNFIDSISRQDSLTDKQVAVLDRVWERVT